MHPLFALPVVMLALLAGACSDSERVATPEQDASSSHGDACSPGNPCSCNSDAGCTETVACTTDGDCSDGKICGASGACLTRGTCLVDADCNAGMTCKQGACAPGSSCGAQAFGATKVAPNVLLVLDRSCSMRKPVRSGGPSKWTEAVGAMDELVESFADSARFGLVMFPDPAAIGDATKQCTDASFPVPIGQGTAGKLRNVLSMALEPEDANYPDGPCVTPIDSAVALASTDPALFDTKRKSYAMLITDGRQIGCNASGGEAGVVETLRGLKGQGVSTFVVGFQSTAADQQSLTSFAEAGGTARPGTPAFYDAADGSSLSAYALA